MAETTDRRPRPRWGTVAVALVLVAGGIWWFTRPAVSEDRTRGLGDYHVQDASQAYFGRHTLFSRPATVRADDVYARIPEYQTLMRKGYRPGTPDYGLLMRKASARFTRAVAVMARAHNHDYVGEAGSIRIDLPGAPPPPDRTRETLAVLD